MKTIAVLNLKGGVAKTTTVANLAYELSAFGGTLLIDADKQGNSTEFYNQYNDDAPAALGEVLAVKDPAELLYTSVIFPARRADGTKYDNLLIMPSNTSLMKSNISLLLDTSTGREKRLRRFLARMAIDVPTMKYCIVDCAPDIDMSSINALMAADLVLVPITLDKNARKGLTEVWEQLTASKEDNPGMIARALITRYRPDQLEKVTGVSDLDLMKTVIRESTQKVETSNDSGKPLSVCSRWSNAARDYRALAEEIIFDTLNMGFSAILE